MFPAGCERRDTAFAPTATLSTRDGAAAVITGYGAVFYVIGKPETEYQIWDDVVERVVPGCFDRTLREDDARSFFNHDANIVLGRKSAGTLKLSVDLVGLRYEVTPPEAALGQTVVESVRRRDVSGSSFMFLPRDIVWREQDGMMIRELHDLQLWEVGPVTFPAYEASTAELRSHLVAEASRAGLRLAAQRSPLKLRRRMLNLRERGMRL